MAQEKEYFELPLDWLRALAGWAADCAERALPVFERHAAEDGRPREAISAAREFARGGRRAASIRKQSLEALAAARGAPPAASAAARAACLAASSAYTHPLVDVRQTAHVVGPAAYAALAIELDAAEGGHEKAVEMLRQAADSAPAEVRKILVHMPERTAGKTPIDQLMHILDSHIRSR